MNWLSILLLIAAVLFAAYEITSFVKYVIKRKKAKKPEKANASGGVDNKHD